MSKDVFFPPDRPLKSKDQMVSIVSKEYTVVL